MFRVQIERNGQIAYQVDVATQAYAVYEARELANAAGDAVEVAGASDLARYHTKTCVIRAIAR